MAMTINGNGSITGLAVGGLPDGTVDNDTIAAATIADAKMASGGGKVLQVLQTTDNTTTTVATTTWTDVGLSLSITPISTTSKIYAIWNMQGNPASTLSGFGSRLMRNATAVSASNMFDAYEPSAQNRAHVSRSFLDSPSLDTAITYKIQVACNNSYSVNFNENGCTTELTLMEIGA